MIEQKVGEFTRKILFKPGFCWARDEPARNYGNGSVRMWFVLIGQKGAVQWQIGTDWMPKAAREDVAMRSAIHRLCLKTPEEYQKPTGWDLGYHSPAPKYEGQEPMHDNCEFTGGKCYYDGSTMNADLLIEGFLNGGDDWVWNRLEAYYRHTFEDAPWPNFDPIIEPHPDDRPKAA